jgi:outer membrane immunogenic protein
MGSTAVAELEPALATAVAIVGHRDVSIAQQSCWTHLETMLKRERRGYPADILGELLRSHPKGGNMKKLLAAAAAAAFICLPGVAAAQDSGDAGHDFAGPRIEARVGWETPTVSDGSGTVYKVGQAVSYGGEVGFDAAVGRKVTLGAYANYDVSNVKVCDGGDCLGEKGNLSAGARIGIILSPRAVLYIKGGYNSITMRATSGGFSGEESKGGVGGALGAEFTLNKNVYAFVEGNYADYGAFYGINLQRRHVAAGLGVRF